MIWCNFGVFFAFAIATAVSAATAADMETTADPASAESQLFASAAYPLIALLHEPGVQDDLRIGERQRDSLTALKDRMEADRQTGARRALEERRKRSVEGAREAAIDQSDVAARLFGYHTAIASSLSSEQLARLKQIYWQHLGPVIFSDNEVCTALNLTPEQRAEISRVDERLRKAEAYRAGERYRTENPAGHGFVIYCATTDYKRQSLERLSELLSDPQREKLQELLGVPCRLPEVHVPYFAVVPTKLHCEAPPRQ